MKTEEVEVGVTAPKLITEEDNGPNSSSSDDSSGKVSHYRHLLHSNILKIIKI